MLHGPWKNGHSYEIEQAFTQLQTEFSRNNNLFTPHYDYPFQLSNYFDEYNNTLNATITQNFSGKPQVVTHWSKLLKPHETCYQILEKHEVALYHPLKFFCKYLYGSTIEVDNSYKHFLTQLQEIADVHRSAGKWMALINSYNIVFVPKDDDEEPSFRLVYTSTSK